MWILGSIGSFNFIVKRLALVIFSSFEIHVYIKWEPVFLRAEIVVTLGK